VTSDRVITVVTEARLGDISAIRLLDEPVRRRVYEWVSVQGRPVGRDETARALEIGRPLATFHLDRLASAGLLESGYRRLNERRGPGAGRPARVYWRGDRDFSVTFPERHYERAAEVFAAALERLGVDAEAGALREAAHGIGEDLAARTELTAGGDGDLMAVLQASGYEPVAEQDGTIRLRNCPFHALVEDHRALTCGANLAMAEGITERTGAKSLPVLDPQPGYCCVAFKPQ
jgi:predicted ArsR family transcriptional regulator